MPYKACSDCNTLNPVAKRSCSVCNAVFTKRRVSRGKASCAPMKKCPDCQTSWPVAKQRCDECHSALNKKPKTLKTAKEPDEPSPSFVHREVVVHAEVVAVLDEDGRELAPCASPFTMSFRDKLAVAWITKMLQSMPPDIACRVAPHGLQGVESFFCVRDALVALGMSEFPAAVFHAHVDALAAWYDPVDFCAMFPPLSPSHIGGASSVARRIEELIVSGR